MEFRYKQLEHELSALSRVFGELGARLSEIAKDVTSPGVTPPEKLIEQIATARTNFDNVRNAVHGHAATMLVSPLPKIGEVVSITAVDTLLKASAAAEENRLSIETERERALGILSRVLAITHKEIADFKPLQECHAKVDELRNSISKVAWPHRHAESESVIASKHPFTTLLSFVENLDTLEDDRWIALEATITETFSKPLFVAASRGKLLAPKAAASEKAPVPAPAPAPAIEKPVEKKVVGEKAPEKPATPAAAPANAPVAAPAAQDKKVTGPAPAPPPVAAASAKPAAPPAVAAEKKETVDKPHAVPAPPQPPAPVPVTVNATPVQTPAAPAAVSQPAVQAPPAPPAAPAAVSQPAVQAPPAPPVAPAPAIAASSTTPAPTIPAPTAPTAASPAAPPQRHPVVTPASAPVTTPPPAVVPAVSTPAPAPPVPVPAATQASTPAAPAPVIAAQPAATVTSAPTAQTNLPSLSALATATEPASDRRVSTPAVETIDKQRKEPRLAAPAPAPQPVLKSEPKQQEAEMVAEQQAGDGQRPQRWGFWRGNR